MTASSKSDLPHHGLLAKLVGSGTGDLTTIKGFVGPSANDGYVCIYATLDDLGESMEVAEFDIVYHESLSNKDASQGAIKLWLKKNAKVNIRRERTKAAVGVSNYLKHEEIVRGKVRIVIPGRGSHSNVCQSVCNVCQSVCGVCQSVCQSGGCSVCQSVCGVCQSVCSANVRDLVFRERFWR